MKVRAKIELLTGAGHSFRGNFRPNHFFASAGFVIGEVQQGAGKVLGPGQTANLVVDFMPEGVPKLAVGSEWELREGPHRLIGYGTVIELLDA